MEAAGLPLVLNVHGGPWPGIAGDMIPRPHSHGAPASRPARRLSLGPGRPRRSLMLFLAEALRTIRESDPNCLKHPEARRRARSSSKGSSRSRRNGTTERPEHERSRRRQADSRQKRGFAAASSERRPRASRRARQNRAQGAWKPYREVQPRGSTRSECGSPSTIR